MITPGALAFVGVRPELGREFVAADTEAGGRKAMVTWQVWQGLFGGRPDIIGQPLWRLDDGDLNQVEIVGVLPRDFFRRVPVVDPAAEAFMPTGVLTGRERADSTFAPLVRLRPGVTIDQVRTVVGTAVDDLRRVIPDFAHFDARLDPADRPGWFKY
jgi:hypothetical protein